MDFDSELKNQKLSSGILREINGLFNKFVFPELEELKDIELTEKLLVYLKKIEIIDSFLGKKEFPIKDDYNLIFYEVFKKRLIIGWEKHMPKYRTILVFSSLIFKTAIKRLLIELNINLNFKTDFLQKIDSTTSFFDLNLIIDTFVKNFQKNITFVEKKILESREKVKKELDSYQEHVKHFFNSN